MARTRREVLGDLWRWSSLALGAGGVIAAERMLSGAPREAPSIVAVPLEVVEALGEDGALIHKGLVVVMASGQILVLDRRCTHLDCPVELDEPRRALVCPCHRSTFDLSGQPTGGPAPTPLQRLPFEIRERELIVSLRG